MARIAVLDLIKELRKSLRRRGWSLRGMIGMETSLSWRGMSGVAGCRIADVDVVRMTGLVAAGGCGAGVAVVGVDTSFQEPSM